MSHTYSQLIYHLVWSTKERQPLITKDLQNVLYEYMAGTFRAIKCHCFLIGGMPDHVHVCLGIPPSISISDTMRTVKVSTTRWIKETFHSGKNFEWQEGYGAFSVSASKKSAIIKYIENQEQHHKNRDFRGEFLFLLQKHGVQFDEKYLWK